MILCYTLPFTGGSHAAHWFTGTTDKIEGISKYLICEKIIFANAAVDMLKVHLRGVISKDVASSVYESLCPKKLTWHQSNNVLTLQVLMRRKPSRPDLLSYC